MRRYFFKNPKWLSWPFHEAIWSINTTEKVLYLTFDDGPDLLATPWVLDQLQAFQAKATFFLIGERIKAQPHVLQKIVDGGHLIGNHTFSHRNGWKLSAAELLSEVQHCQSLISEATNARLFRPPYGNIRFSQLKKLKSEGFNVVLWSHLSGDFDPDLDIPKSLSKMKAAKPGAILVFHDSEKAFENMRILLPEVLQHFSTLGYQFKTLPICSD